MEIDLLIKVGGIGMVVAVLCQVLTKAGRDDQATLLSISGIIVILLIVIEKVGDMLSLLREVFGL